MDLKDKATKHYIITISVSSIAYILIGIVKLALPELASDIMSYVVGLALVVMGILRIVFRFIRKDASRVFQNDIATGVVLVAGGIYLFVNTEFLGSWLPVLLGFAVVFDSIIKLQHSFDLSKFKFEYWGVGLIVSMVTGVMGVLLIIFGVEVNAVFFAIVLIIDGIANIIVLSLVAYHVNQALAVQKATIEAQAQGVPYAGQQQGAGQGNNKQ